ncbi:MAG TPA: hypothetical protein VFC66_03905 [Anaerolineaceae bacterium]|nr:hypothetical protein [Anaerolineaceae bacterium]
MNIGPFFSKDAISLTLAADQHFLESPSALDLVWQLETEECAPVSLMSTLGLQAQSFQIMPQVSLNKIAQERIQDFLCQPRIDKLYSNYVKLTTSPFPEVESIIEFWVRSGDLVQGRISITNHSDNNLEAGARLAARLVTLQGNSELKHTRQGYETCLKGQTGNLNLSLAMAGGSKTVMSPNLALEQSKHLKPEQTMQTLWQCELLRQGCEKSSVPVTFPVNWDGEVARIEVANQTRMIQITTPESDWDAVLFTNQNQAFQLLRKNAENQIRPDRTRGIHSAFNPTALSVRADISALELWQLLGSLLPAQGELAADMLATYLKKTATAVSANPHIALPFPCLCDLGWRVHQQLQKKDYLLEIYPLVRVVCLAWFSCEHDRDQDGIPEWCNIEQCGLTSLPAFDLIDEKGMPTRINFTEQLNLAALLAIDLEQLRKMAQIAEDQTTISTIDGHLTVLGSFIARFAENEFDSACLDRESGLWHSGEILFQGNLEDFGAKSIYLSKPARLNVRLKPEVQIKKPSVFYLYGENQAGEQVVEPIEPANLLWLPGSYFYTTDHIFRRVDKIGDLDIKEGHLQIHRANLHSLDLGILFAASPDKGVVTGLKDVDPPTVNSMDILSSYKFGLPENLDPKAEKKVVNLGWNLLILADLIRRGEKEAAFQLLSQLLRAQSSLLRLEHSNSDRWNAETSQLSGLRNTIGGLLPVNLVLELAGIRIFNENKVSLQGQNPFPWPIKVGYRGLEVTRDGKNATVRFQDGTMQHHFGSSLKTFTNEVEQSAAS